VFGFLASMGNHWRLADGRMRLESISPDGTGGRFTLVGPLGVRRSVRTELTRVREPHYLVGHAYTGRRTAARVSWRIRRLGGGSRVVLTATVLSAGPLDRLLLSAGGAVWLERRFAHVLSRLHAELALPLARAA
jgi:hypothetical protein